MKKAKLISTILYSLATAITLLMASKFLMADQYFVYHAEASGMQWAEIQTGLQTVYLAVFKICGAGFLSIGFAMAVLIAVPFIKHNQSWSYYTIPASGLLFWSITLATTVYISLSTPASPPWAGSLTVVFLLLAGFLFSLFARET